MLDIEVRCRNNYFMSDDEAHVIWAESLKWNSRLNIFISFALFRGLRCKEICAIRIQDFNEDFSKIRVRIQKTRIEDWLPLIPEHSQIIKEYIKANYVTMQNGYLFPALTKKANKHWTTGVAWAQWQKFKMHLEKDHKWILDNTISKKGQKRYRIDLHSLRRYFETHIWDKMQTKDINALANIMRYKKPSTIFTYINPYETWKHERAILQNTFGKDFLNMSKFDKGQTELSKWK